MAKQAEREAGVHDPLPRLQEEGEEEEEEEEDLDLKRASRFLTRKGVLAVA